MIGSKMAIILNGVAYKQEYDKGSIDYRKCLAHFKGNISGPLSERYDVDIHFITYDSVVNDELLSDLQPVSYTFLPANLSGQTSMEVNQKLRADNMLTAIDKVKETETAGDFRYEQILLMRFDLGLYRSILTYSIDWNKFNFVSFGEDYANYDCDDNMFLFKREYLDAFCQCCQKIRNGEMITHYIHNYLNELIGIDNIGYFFPGGLINNAHVNAILQWYHMNRHVIDTRPDEVGRNVDVCSDNRARLYAMRPFPYEGNNYIEIRNSIYFFSRAVL